MRKHYLYALALAVMLAGVIAVRLFSNGAETMVHAETSRHEAELKNPDGSWKYTNALARETSPYLLQHAHNPVQWYPWGDEAFQLAKKTGKPIFLSVGYSTCYWCHVMERQVFENPEIAALMNEHFVNIKVDREERPDVDDIYMVATQLFTRSGGWPMSVFLTPPGAEGEDDPGLKPFWAATYIPPQRQDRIPGFPEVVDYITGLWHNQRDQVIQQANQVADVVRANLAGSAENTEDGQIDIAMVQQVTDAMLQGYDRANGGFGDAPKFPQPANLLFLLKVHRNNPNDELWKALAHTLDRMARGGMYDQVGGGFHRYSTDEKWLVPHFEKMLYDNGQLVETYCIAQDIKPRQGDPDFYPRVVREVCEYVLREMTDESGTFWSAQDAEVDAREGGNYVWTKDQIGPAVADEPLAKLAGKMYGLDLGTNFTDPHAPQAQPVNVLFLPQPLHELAQAQSMSLGELLDRKAQIDKRMLEVRDRRNQPTTDDKVIVSWNGMMIAGLARAGRTLDEPRYTAAAATAADYILKHMRSTDGGLYRTMRQGEVKIPAFLDDYAYLVHGLLELHRSDGDPRWLDSARQLDEVAVQQFATPGGGYYDTLEDQADLFVRTRTTYDGAIPSGNSQMVHNIVDLHELTGETAYLDRAVADLSSFADSMKRMGGAMVHMHHALLRAIELAPRRFAAQPFTQPKRMHIDVEPDRLDLADGQATLRVKLKIDDGYHINANKPGMEWLIPTAIKLADGNGLKLDVKYPKALAKNYTFSDDPINIYEGEVVFEVTVSKDGLSSAATQPRISVTYQMCSESNCLSPQTIELPVEIAVGG